MQDSNLRPILAFEVNALTYELSDGPKCETFRSPIDEVFFLICMSEPLKAEDRVISSIQNHNNVCLLSTPKDNTTKRL